MNLAKEDLQKTVYGISEKLYQAAQAAAPTDGAAGGPTQDADGNTVYDAEYKDVNEDDKK
jgi:molecular chaperone DnaK